MKKLSVDAKINSFISRNKTKSNKTLAGLIATKFKKSINAEAVRKRRLRMGLDDVHEHKSLSPQEQIQADKQKLLDKKIKKEEDKKYSILLFENERLAKELEAAVLTKNAIDPVSFVYKPFTKDSESVAVVLASDWHIEENVRPETIDGFNEYNLRIARQRIEQFFRTTLRLVEIESQFTNIDTLVLALLGDFISGNIHDALLEICELQPIDATIEAENLIIGGIQYILDHSKLNLIIPCHMGNHSRITKKVHIATEDGNSLEKIMYKHIQNHFRDNPRVNVLISPAYISYLTFWDYTICFQHGHAVQYQGGIGGLTIPLKKAVAQWQKKRRVNLYCLGHWHQFLDIGEAIVNGSMIGYSSYVQFIKGDPERPKQTFFVINKKHNEKIVVRPILFTV